MKPVECLRLKDCRSCSGNDVVSLDVPAMSKAPQYVNTMMFSSSIRTCLTSVDVGASP